LLLDGLGKESIKSWVRVRLDLVGIGTVWEVLDCWWLFSLWESKLNSLGWWGLRDKFLLDSVVVILEDLN